MKNDRKGGASQRCLPATCRHDSNPKSHKKHPEAGSERWRGIGVRLAIQQVQPPKDPAMNMNLLYRLTAATPHRKRMGLFTFAAFVCLC